VVLGRVAGGAKRLRATAGIPAAAMGRIGASRAGEVMKYMVWFGLAMGCAGSDGGGELASCDADGLSALASASVDGREWAGSGGTWMETGSSIQITIESASDLNLTLRGIRNSNGDSVAEAVSAGNFPVVVDLDGEDGSGSIMDLRNQADSYGSGQPGGSGMMSILGVEGGILTACFFFSAVNNDSVIMTVADGKVQIDG
jgi:hypothetical protein